MTLTTGHGSAADARVHSAVQNALFRAIPHLYDPPDGWTLSTSWQRAQEEHDRGGPINHAERMVWLSGGESSHRVVFCLTGSTLRCKCSCRGFQFNGDWCAHVATCWWRWVGLGEIDVWHLEAERRYDEPPRWLRVGQTAPINDEDGLRELPPRRLEAWLHCDYGDEGVRPFARRTDRAYGTVGNHLRWARESVGRCR